MRTDVVVDPDDASRLIVARYGDHEHMKAVAEACKVEHNEGRTGSSELRVLGHYPAEVVDNYCARTGISLQEFMRDPKHANSIMRDPALAAFRVHKGAV